jgi:hypothetical protein
MNIVKYVKSNICVIGMIVGILLVGSLFFIPLQAHGRVISSFPLAVEQKMTDYY